MDSKCLSLLAESAHRFARLAAHWFLEAVLAWFSFVFAFRQRQKSLSILLEVGEPKDWLLEVNTCWQEMKKRLRLHHADNFSKYNCAKNIHFAVAKSFEVQFEVRLQYFFRLLKDQSNVWDVKNYAFTTLSSFEGNKWRWKKLWRARSLQRRRHRVFAFLCSREFTPKVSLLQDS